MYTINISHELHTMVWREAARRLGTVTFRDAV
jgi:hypothetical protein